MDYAQLERLEKRVSLKPNDRQAIRQLVTMLEYSNLPKQHLGAYSKAQLEVTGGLKKGWQAALVDTGRQTAAYSGWMKALDTQNIQLAVPIAQIYVGQTITINGEHGNCGQRLNFFEETKVICGLCHECYKVQILPENLEGMFQVYFLLLNLQLPRDNARKSMIELREAVKFPYKAYIYCESIAEAKECLAIFRAAQAEFEITGVHSKISHGCSEYSMEYPAFKYSEGAGDDFETPSDWSGIEEAYFTDIPMPAPERPSNSKPILSLRDVFAFRTWVRFAELIGDKSCEKYGTRLGPELPQPFVKRVQGQARDRHREMVELSAQG